MIKPTLFIGLGTTGLKILKSLRQLMFEEYGQEGLPIFRYVSIETDSGIDGTDDSLIDEIQVVRATIPVTAPISDKLDPNQPAYNEHLEKWLNPGLLDFVAAFTEGAANIRMAGRLCLWENWAVVNNTLANALTAIKAPDTMVKAVPTLTEHYNAKGYPVPDGGPIDGASVNIYIVGSLCGGSCSGMLIDVAYFCRHLIGDDATKKVYGIFTMFDEDQAAGTDEAISVRAANCFSALWELNYYNHINTIYNVTFPSGHLVNTTNKPFDYAKFVSRNNMSGGIFAKDGQFDEDGLNLMVALNLFADTAGDTDGTKAAILADGVGFPGIGEVKDVPKGEIAVMVRAMASFGLTAVWYPKYRIASAATYSIGTNLCGSWLKTHVDEAVVVDQGKKAWTTILEENIDVLTFPKGKLPLKAQIEDELGKAEVAFGLTKSADPLKNKMETAPPGPSGPFKIRFAPGGDYHDLISMQVSVCQNAFRHSIEQVFNTQLSQIDFKGTYGLGDVQAFFLTLDKEIATYIEMLPTGLPSLDLKQLNYDLMRSAEKNIWTKLIFLHNQSVRDEREKLIANYRKLILEDRESIYQSVRNYFLRPVLQEVRAQLGFGVPGIDGDVTVKQKLDRIEANLKSCVNKFNESYESAIDQPEATAIKIVTNNPKNRVDEDAKALSTKIFKTDTHADLLKESSMATFLVKEPQDLMNQMIETYRRLSLEQIPVKNVVEQVRNILDAGGTEGIGIKNLATRSDSYQKFIPGYVGFGFAPPLKIISGHDPTEGDGVLAALQNQFVDLNGNIKFPRIGSSSVDHLLFFYQSESGFALDDLASYKMLKMQFDKCPGPYGHLTHQNPDFYDLELYHKTHKLKRWCSALGRLVPEICQYINKNAFSGVFYPTKNGYVYEYNVDGLSRRLGLHDDNDGIKRFSQKQNETAYDNFFNEVRLSFTQLDPDQIKNLINKMLMDIGDPKEHMLLSEFFGQFLDDVDADDGFTDDADAEEALDLDFFKVIPQTHQDTPTEEPDETPSNPYQQVDSESAVNTTTDADGYTEIAFEEEDVQVTAVQETDANFGETPQQDDVTDEDEEGFATVETEPSPTDESAEDATVEESIPEQQPQPAVAPEPDEQKQQTQPTKEFSVADADVKQLQRRDNTRKKE